MASSNYSMPAIDLDACELTAEERQIAERIVNRGKLRASKPKIEYSTVERNGRKYRQPDEIGGRAAYVWRMVTFSISPIGQHHCMPCTADFDIPVDGYQERRAEAKRLDMLVDKIIASVPKTQHHGTMRWARALGYA